MKIVKLLDAHHESFVINLSTAHIKTELNQNVKHFHCNWVSEHEFVLSLNFSFGSNLLFDTNYHNTKSDIIVLGRLHALTDSKTKIILETKSKYWLMLMLIPSLVMTVLKLTILTGIPFPFILIFPIAFGLVAYYIRKEDQRLIKLFKTLLDQ